jgi:AbrB family looped-hinge helix DNA binding protein
VAKVTSKRQVTIPKAIADQYRIAPGDELRFEPAGEAIRVRRAHSAPTTPDSGRRLELFDRATQRQQERQRGHRFAPAAERGWSREDLYERGLAR